MQSVLTQMEQLKQATLVGMEQSDTAGTASLRVPEPSGQVVLEAEERNVEADAEAADAEAASNCFISGQAATDMIQQLPSASVPSEEAACAAADVSLELQAAGNAHAVDVGVMPVGGQLVAAQVVVQGTTGNGFGEKSDMPGRQNGPLMSPQAVLVDNSAGAYSDIACPTEDAEKDDCSNAEHPSTIHSEAEIPEENGPLPAAEPRTDGLSTAAVDDGAPSSQDCTEPTSLHDNLRLVGATAESAGQGDSKPATERKASQSINGGEAELPEVGMQAPRRSQSRRSMLSPMSGSRRSSLLAPDKLAHGPSLGDRHSRPSHRASVLFKLGKGRAMLDDDMQQGALNALMAQTLDSEQSARRGSSFIGLRTSALTLSDPAEARPSATNERSRARTADDSREVTSAAAQRQVLKERSAHGAAASVSISSWSNASAALPWPMLDSEIDNPAAAAAAEAQQRNGNRHLLSQGSRPVEEPVVSNTGAQECDSCIQLLEINESPRKLDTRCAATLCASTIGSSSAGNHVVDNSSHGMWAEPSILPNGPTRAQIRQIYSTAAATVQPRLERGMSSAVPAIPIFRPGPIHAHADANAGVAEKVPREGLMPSSAASQARLASAYSQDMHDPDTGEPLLAIERELQLQRKILMEHVLPMRHQLNHMMHVLAQHESSSPRDWHFQHGVHSTYGDQGLQQEEVSRAARLHTPAVQDFPLHRYAYSGVQHNNAAAAHVHVGERQLLRRSPRDLVAIRIASL